MPININDQLLQVFSHDGTLIVLLVKNAAGQIYKIEIRDSSNGDCLYSYTHAPLEGYTWQDGDVRIIGSDHSIVPIFKGVPKGMSSGSKRLIVAGLVFLAVCWWCFRS